MFSRPKVGAKGKGLKQLRGKGERAVKYCTESKLCVNTVLTHLGNDLTKTARLVKTVFE